MKKRNKKYRPKPIAQEGGLLALNRIHARGHNAAGLNDEQVTDIGAAYWLALHNLTAGNASEESWCTVVCAVNIALVLAESGVGEDHEQDCVDALDGLFRAKKRGDENGIYRLDGDALQAVRWCLQIHDQQVKAVARRDLVKAMQIVRDRVDSGNVYS